jgi:serine/threonine protein kinase
MATDASPNSLRLYNDNPSALPVGTRLGEFELLGLLGVGGFGIVYLALDHALEREVAVKEYMPAQLAGRTQTLHVSLRSQADADTFALGLRSFVNEARLLARFDHPSLLKVYRFWEANGTAYMAMPVLRGRTLKEERQDMAAAPDEAWLRALLQPLLGALERLHDEGVYHRDIAPDNIQIEPGGRPVLLDFGAARRVISDKSQTLTAILKPAYAPIEQYAEAGAVRQGPWTDIYALGATLYYLLMKRPPAPATTRTVHDEASALTPQAFARCSAQFLRIVDWMLAPRPNDRPQSVAALRDVLEGRAEPPLWRKAAPESGDLSDETVILDKPLLAGFPRTEIVGRAAPQPSLPAMTQDAPAVPPSPAADQAVLPAPAPVNTGRPKSKSWVLLGSALAGVGALGVLAAMLWHMSGTSPLSAGSRAASAAAVVAAAPAPASASVLPVPAALPNQAIAASSAIAKAAAPSAEAASQTVAVVMAQTSAPAIQESNTTTFTAAADGAVMAALPASAAAAPVRPAVKRPLPPSSAASRAAMAAQQAAAPKTASVPAASTVESATTTSPPSVVVAAAPATDTNKPAVMGPEGRCSGLPYFRNLVCMERECLRGEFQSHPDCLKWRRAATDATNK